VDALCRVHVVVGFAAGSEKEAWDGGGVGSYFTEALLSELSSKGALMSMGAVLEHVRDCVIAASESVQCPSTYSSKGREDMLLLPTGGSIPLLSLLPSPRLRDVLSSKVLEQVGAWLPLRVSESAFCLRHLPL
jgi:hypothetical protein